MIIKYKNNKVVLTKSIYEYKLLKSKYVIIVRSLGKIKYTSHTTVNCEMRLNKIEKWQLPLTTSMVYLLK